MLRQLTPDEVRIISTFQHDGPYPLLTVGARYRFGVDAAFPLSDHADYDELLEYVRMTGAKTVWTHHGFVEEFARDLRRLGYQAEPLRTPGPQLSLF